SIPLNHVATRVDSGNLAKLAMGVHADKISTLHRGLHALGVLATDNIASLTNAHHGRPVFFNLQTNIAAPLAATPGLAGQTTTGVIFIKPRGSRDKPYSRRFSKVRCSAVFLGMTSLSRPRANLIRCQRLLLWCWRIISHCLTPSSNPLTSSGAV